MSQDTENKQCQICQGYLFEDDDVVVCPECGAPHHRDCWHTVGHCGLAELHGTDRQYPNHNNVNNSNNNGAQDNGPAYESYEPYERLCPHCGKRARATDALFCPYCGKQYGTRPNQQNYNTANNTENRSSETDNNHQNAGPNFFFGNINFEQNSYGGIPKDSEIEGIKVEHVAKFVGSNARRYIPRFAVMSDSNRHSWNWGAFLFPSVWCMARKMYATGIMYFILMLASSLCFVPFFQVLGTFVTEEIATQNSYAYANSVMEIIRENFSAFGWPAFALLGVGIVLAIVPRIICGKTADWTYRGFALNKVREILNNPDVEDTDEELMRKGSVSIFLMLVTFMAGEYLPSIIATLIW